MRTIYPAKTINNVADWRDYIKLTRIQLRMKRIKEIIKIQSK